jgi:PAS domain S-box-containing protein
MSEKDATDRDSPREAVELCREAEQRLHASQPRHDEALSDADARALVHQLQVHQIELEMQTRELQRAEVEAQESEAQWQATFDAVRDPLFLLDTEQRILRCNKAAEALFEKSAAEMQGRRCCEIAHGATAPIADCPVLRLSDSLRRESTEVDMGDRSFSVMVDPVLDAKGKLVCVVHVFRDITEHKLAEHAIRAANESVERAKFEEHLLAAAEDIQRRIAQDLHDDVGQELTGLGLKAETLVDLLASANSPAEKLAADIAAALERTHDKVRRLSRGMLPAELEEGLLAGALEQLAATMSRRSRVKCRFTCFHPNPVFDSRVATHLYRIAQEAVANALRHSGARRIRITLAQEQGASALRINDNGKGIAAGPDQSKGMGLRTMDYRAGLIGGKLEIGRGPRGGTQVECRLAAAADPAEPEE